MSEKVKINFSPFCRQFFTESAAFYLMPKFQVLFRYRIKHTRKTSKYWKKSLLRDSNRSLEFQTPVSKPLHHCLTVFSADKLTNIYPSESGWQSNNIFPQPTGPKSASSKAAGAYSIPNFRPKKPGPYPLNIFFS